MSAGRSNSKKPDPRSLWILVTGMVMLQCGVIGPPIAPEDVGVAPIIERQKKRDADRSGARGQAGTMPENNVTAEPTEDLPEPPLRSMGTR